MVEIKKLIEILNYIYDYPMVTKYRIFITLKLSWNSVCTYVDFLKSNNMLKKYNLPNKKIKYTLSERGYNLMKALEGVK